MAELSRRRFLSFLGAAPVAVKLGIFDAFDPHRVIFDMGRGRIWTPEKKIASLNEINAISQKYLDNVLADVLFQPSPFFEYLTGKKTKPFWGGHRNSEGIIVGAEDARD